uniref:GTD-binding domain-containing protein n=1 Tax=Ananas comosus var. bracteatus TaxID=296719 RepID=A0A6V7PB26_ANACO|nr:unnamed protein product [Ananas comosus var. bracteatus]
MAVRTAHRFSSALSSAVLEWLLMLLLFVDAVYSYIVTKFARLCQLQTPCVLCSRLDHILGNEKSGFYLNLICKKHKSEISSLALCRAHQKLADVHELCENCLLSFATEKKSNLETYRSLVGKLGLDFDQGEHDYFDEDDEVPLLDESMSSFPFERNCSCCSEPLKKMSRGVGVLWKKSSGIKNTTETGNSIPDLVEHESTEPNGVYHSKDEGADHLSHIGYRELKITSDSESETPFIDGNETNELREDFVPQDAEMEPVDVHTNSLYVKPSDSAVIEKSIPSKPILEKKEHPGESHDVETMASAIANEHALDESKCSRSEVKTDPAPSEMTVEDPQSVHSEDVNTTLDNDSEDACAAQKVPTLTEESSKGLNSLEINPSRSQIASEPSPSLNTDMSLSDAYKLAIGQKSSLPSPTLAEVLLGKDSSKVHEDLKSLISQISAARRLETPWTDWGSSPRVQHGQGDETVLQNITKRLSIERNESGFESLDGSIVSEIEGESTVDRLKRQIDLDRKSISLLYKELEEERSASAIAANQAMAMITRLQEEKASMQMEALQYQRMMEEQAEYDQEALQKSNEILAQKEKEVLLLEAELENYRNSKARESESGLFKNSLLKFEDEKVYISNRLRKLEEELHLFSNNGAFADASKITAEEEEIMESDNQSNSVAEDDERGNGQCIVCDSKEDSNSGKIPHIIVQRNDGEVRFCKHSEMIGESDLVALECEISDLSERLEALEADHNFLEHSINSLRNGEEGVRFIQEIASHLQELREIGIARK